jgi:hypothetical protein
VGFAPDGSLGTAPAPTGRVTVSGIVAAPDGFDGTAPKDIDPVLASGDILPAVVIARASDPPEPNAATAAGPEVNEIVPVPPPELSEGPHLSYAVQWFIFSTIAVVGYPVVLRRVVIRRGKEVDDSDTSVGDGGSGRGGGPGGSDSGESAEATDLERELDHLLRHGD